MPRFRLTRREAALTFGALSAAADAVFGLATHADVLHVVVPAAIAAVAGYLTREQVFSQDSVEAKVAEAVEHALAPRERAETPAPQAAGTTPATPTA